MQIQAWIGIIGVAVGMLLSFLTFNRNRDKDVRSDAVKSAQIESKLDTISVGVSNIQVDIKASERRITELEKYVIRVEESTKSAHKRLDKLEGGE